MTLQVECRAKDIVKHCREENHISMLNCCSATPVFHDTVHQSFESTSMLDKSIFSSSATSPVLSLGFSILLRFFHV